MGGVVKTILSPISAVAGAVFGKPKIPKIGQQPTITSNAAAEAAYASDELRRRRGYGANVLTGASGAEASTPGAKLLLGQ